MTEDASLDLRPDVTVRAHSPEGVHEHPPGDLDQPCINTVGTLAMDAVEQANSGPPGTPMRLPPLACAPWTRYLEHDSRDPSWLGRYRFVPSAGHASALLYPLLRLTGYAPILCEIRLFRKWGSETPGHSERRRVSWPSRKCSGS